MKALVVTILMILSAPAFAGWLDSYSDPALTTLGGVKLTKKGLEAAIGKKFNRSAIVYNVYRNWETWGPSYVFQDFIGVRVFSRNITFALHTGGKVKTPFIYACRLNVMKTDKNYQVVLKECDGETANTPDIDITENVMAVSQHVQDPDEIRRR